MRPDPDRGPGTPGYGTGDRRPVVVDLGDHETSDVAAVPGGRRGAASARPPAAPSGPSADTVPAAEEARSRRRRTAWLAAGAVALLVVTANLVPRGDAPPPLGKGVEVRDRPLGVCEAVAFANQTGGLPSKPTVLPDRSSGYYAYTDPATRAAVVVGLTYQDGTVSLCRPVREAGTGSPQPRQRELPLLGRGDTYAYEIRSGGLTLIGERSADGTVTRDGAPAS
jgi:hypothetical protein